MNYLSYCKLPFRLKRLCCSKDIKKTNCNESVSEDNPKSVLSWNIQSLFCFTTPLKVKNIIENLLIFNSDVICLQEVFEDSIKQQINFNKKKKTTKQHQQKKNEKSED